MRYQRYLLSALFSLSVMQAAIADGLCTKEAIEKANNQYLKNISSYISLFSNQNNQEAVTELSKIKPSAAFKRKHKEEIKLFDKSGYQPSEQFCHDAYANLENLKKQISQVIKKYKMKNI